VVYRRTAIGLSRKDRRPLAHATGGPGFELVRRELNQGHQLAEYYFGDSYSVTGYRPETTVWMAWPFNLANLG